MDERYFARSISLLRPQNESWTGNYCRIKQWRGLATRYDKHAVTYRAAVVLNAVIAWTKQLSDTP